MARIKTLSIVYLFAATSADGVTPGPPPFVPDCFWFSAADEAVMKTLPAVLVVLLALAPVASAALLPAADAGDGAALTADATETNVGLGGVGVGGPSDTDADPLDNRSIRVLSLPAGGTNASAVETQRVDLGPGLAFDRFVSQTRLRTLTTVERVRSAAPGDERQRLILGELNDIEQRVVTLRTAQQTALSAFASGSISPRQLLLRLARIDAQARALEHRRARLQKLAEETQGLGLSARRFATLERELDTFTGPVRERVGSVVAGRNDTARVYVATSSDGIVLTTLADGRYLREAYRGDLRDFGASGSLSPEEALNITAEQYPVVWELRANNTAVVGAGSIYNVSIPHEYGRLTTLIDTGTQRVFMETQTRALASFSSHHTITRSRNDLQMTVNRSYPGGPVRISLVDARTGNPVNANITVGPASGGDSDFVGYTGSDGVLWTLSPEEEYTVFAIKGNSVVAIQAKPLEPPRVYPSDNASAGNSTATSDVAAASTSASSSAPSTSGPAGNAAATVTSARPA